MAWFSRFTRFGDVHMVFGQEQSISCGVACVIMAAFKINKIRPGTRAVFSEQDILSRATALFGPNPLGQFGLNNPQMVQLLNDPAFGMSGWRLQTLPRNQVSDRIISTVGSSGAVGPTINVNPVIVGVDWNGGGGHWVVVDTVREFMGSTYATVCDPWDANVHVTPMQRARAFEYTGRPVAGVDIWGTRNSYNTPSVGSVFLGDIITR